MNTTSTISASTLDATPRSRTTRRMAAIGALAATVANVALSADTRLTSASW